MSAIHEQSTPPATYERNAKLSKVYVRTKTKNHMAALSAEFDQRPSPGKVAGLIIEELAQRDLLDPVWAVIRKRLQERGAV